MICVIITNVVVRGRNSNIGRFRELDCSLCPESQGFVPRLKQVLWDDEATNFVVP